VIEKVLLVTFAVVVGAGLLYAAAWVVSGAVYDRKMEYNRKLLRQLEENRNAEEKEIGKD